MSEHTPILSLVWQIAAIEAADAQYEFIEPEHVFIGLCKLEGFANTNRLRALGVPESQIMPLSAEIDLLMGLFNRFKISTSTMRRELRQHKGRGPFTASSSEEDLVMHRSPETRNIFARATEVARQTGAPLVAVFHLLAGLVEDPQSELVAWLQSKGIDVVGLKEAAQSTIAPLQPAMTPAQPAPQEAPPSEERDPLKFYSRDLIQLARQGKIEPNPTYDDKILQIVQILNRRNRNNPLLLVQDNDTGKGVVECLAWQIVHDPSLSAVSDKQIVEMNLTDLAASIKYQGEFAERLQSFIRAAMDVPDMLVFISGIEAIIGSGSIHVDMEDVIRELVGALAEDKLQFVGSTSPAEYHHYISRRPDLEEYFQPLAIGDQPSTIEDLKPPPVDATQLQAVKASQPLQWPEQPQEEPKKSLLNMMLEDLQGRLTRFGLQLQVTQSARHFLVRLGENKESGSPSLRTVIAQQVEEPLGGMLLRGEVDYGQTIVVDVRGNELCIKMAGR
jgi:ATP-dependent Clp protease ATP-binding subunit ClpA